MTDHIQIRGEAARRNAEAGKEEKGEKSSSRPGRLFRTIEGKVPKGSIKKIGKQNSESFWGKEKKCQGGEQMGGGKVGYQL